MPRSPWTTAPRANAIGQTRRGYRFEEIPNNQIEVGHVQAGMVSQIPRDRVPAESARDLVNARIRDYWTGRRPGTQTFGPTKPDSNQVLRIVTFIREDNTILICRITASAFHVSDGTTWQSYSILDVDGNSTTFPTGARFSTAQIFDSLYLADGTNPVWKVDFDSAKVRQIDGAPKASYVTTFAERIIAGNVAFTVGGIAPNAFAWPVNAEPTDWSGTGSGFDNLAETDVGNHITGLEGFEAQMVVFRRKSIAHTTRQPFARNPFRTVEVVGGIGCDLPYSIARTPFGIVFADQRTRDVYLYAPGSRPQSLAKQVNRDILADLDSLDFAEGAYDPFEKEYHLGVVESGQTELTKTWVLNLEKGSWSYDDGPQVSTIGVVSIPGDYTIIDDLSGDIDSQNPSPSGTIDDYGDEGEFTPTLFKGTGTGEVLQQTYDADNDYDATQFEFTFQSPNVGSISRRRQLKQVIAAIEALSTGDYDIENSNDEDSAWRNTKSVTLSSTGRQTIQLKNKPISGDDLYWRLRATAPQFRLLNWSARILEKGLKHQ